MFLATNKFKLKNNYKSEVTREVDLAKGAKNIYPTNLNVWTIKKYGYQDQLFMKKPIKKIYISIIILDEI